MQRTTEIKTPTETITFNMHFLFGRQMKHLARLVERAKTNMKEATPLVSIYRSLYQIV